MNLQELYDFTRTSLDSDDTELPDDLLAVWATAAENRIQAAIGDARQYKNVETLVWDGTTQVMTPTSLAQVTSISGPEWQLIPISHEDALRRWPLNEVEGTPVTTGTPTHWSYTYDGAAAADTTADLSAVAPDIWLWPSPSASGSYVLQGRRTLGGAAGSLTAHPDVPPAFHPLIGQYMVSRGNQMQSNVTVAAMEMNRFEQELDVLVREWRRPWQAETSTLGGARSRTFESPTVRLRYPFE